MHLRPIRRILRRANRKPPRRRPHSDFLQSRFYRWGLDRTTADAWLAVDHIPRLPAPDDPSRSYADFWQCRNTARELHRNDMPHQTHDIAAAVAQLRVSYYGSRVRPYAAPGPHAAAAAFDTITNFDAALNEWTAAGVTAGRPQFSAF